MAKKAGGGGCFTIILLGIAGFAAYGYLKKQEAGPTPTATPSAAAPLVQHSELGNYVKAGRTWRTYLVPKGITGPQMIALARELHRKHPKDSFRFVDDASGYDDYRKWDQGYLEDKHPYPKEWAAKHYLAMLNQMITDRGLRWQLHVESLEGLYMMPKGDSSMILAELD